MALRAERKKKEIKKETYINSPILHQLDKNNDRPISALDHTILSTGERKGTDKPDVGGCVHAWILPTG